MLGLDQLHRLRPRRPAQHLIALGFQPFGQQPEHRRVVIDEQDFGRFVGMRMAREESSPEKR